MMIMTSADSAPSSAGACAAGEAESSGRAISNVRPASCLGATASSRGCGASAAVGVILGAIAGGGEAGAGGGAPPATGGTTLSSLPAVTVAGRGDVSATGGVAACVRDGTTVACGG